MDGFIADGNLTYRDNIHMVLSAASFDKYALNHYWPKNIAKRTREYFLFGLKRGKLENVVFEAVLNPNTAWGDDFFQQQCY